MTFGDLADFYIKVVLKAVLNYQMIDILYDRYREETIMGDTRA